jgi:ribosome-associated protein
MIRIGPGISIDEGELTWRFVRASGPGGQHVNKASTAVQLRFDATSSESLPPEVRRRLLTLAGERATAEGEIVIDARNSRSQSRNREDALARLVDLIRRAARPPRRRLKTRPTAASRRRRLEYKRQRSEKKQRRRYRPPGR